MRRSSLLYTQKRCYTFLDQGRHVEDSPKNGSVLSICNATICRIQESGFGTQKRNIIEHIKQKLSEVGKAKFLHDGSFKDSRRILLTFFRETLW